MTASDGTYLAKVSRFPEANEYLAHEARVLGELGTTDLHYKEYFPPLVETFTVDRGRKVVNVLSYTAGGHTLEQVRYKYTIGIDGVHLVWLFKRLLTAIGYAHRLGWLHTAVFPTHIIIYPHSHSVQLIDWIYAVHVAERVGLISNQFLSWYPSDVTRRQLTGPRLDIMLAAASMVYAVGGDPNKHSIPYSVPSRLRSFLHGCLINAGQVDAWDLYDQLSDAAQDVYGKPKFQVLAM